MMYRVPVGIGDEGWLRIGALTYMGQISYSMYTSARRTDFFSEV